MLKHLNSHPSSLAYTCIHIHTHIGTHTHIHTHRHIYTQAHECLYTFSYYTIRHVLIPLLVLYSIAAVFPVGVLYSHQYSARLLPFRGYSYLFSYLTMLEMKRIYNNIYSRTHPLPSYNSVINLGVEITIEISILTISLISAWGLWCIFFKEEYLHNYFYTQDESFLCEIVQ